MFEARIGAPQDHELVRALQAKAAELFAAGAADFGSVNFANRVFLCPATIAALPLHARLFGTAIDQRMRDPLLQLDYQKPVPWGEVFEDMKAASLDGLDKSWKVKRMLLHEVARPRGGFRLNFGDSFGDKPIENPLFNSYQDIAHDDFEDRAAARVKQAPVWLRFDALSTMSKRERREITGLFGPRAMQLAGSVSRLGNSLALDVYSGCRPGDGLVGTFLDPKAGPARVLGAPLSNLGGVLAVNLGKHFTRTARTMIRAALQQEEMKQYRDLLSDLLDAWTGELTVMIDGPAPPAGVEFRRAIKALKALHGTVTFAVDDGAAVKQSLAAFLRSPAARVLDMDLEPVAGDEVAFKVFGAKHLVIRNSERLVSLAVHDTLQGCVADLTTVLAPFNSKLPAAKLGLAQGPVRLWVHHRLVQYVHSWARYVAPMIAGRAERTASWSLTQLEKGLLADDVAATLQWSRQVGTVLRILL